MRIMPKVTLVNSEKTIEFEPATLSYSRHGKPGSILDVALNSGIPLEHACGGVCACTTCHVWVRQGGENLSRPEEDELDRLDLAADLELCSRLGCQAVVRGDVTVEIPPWNRNYVSEEGGALILAGLPELASK